MASFGNPRLGDDDAAAGRALRDDLIEAGAEVPDAFVLGANAEANAARARATYEAFLWKRLKPPRPFVP